jgi:hypothetical protein
MQAETITQEAGPGWRELVESLHEQLEAAREREATLLKLLQMDREALVYLSKTGRPRPTAARPPGQQPAPPHQAQILALLEQHPTGLTRAAIEAALGGTLELEGILDGLARRGRIYRLGKGVFAFPGHNETSPQAKEMSYEQTASQ